MTIAIVSMIRDNWGGSEEIWAELARVALAEGHRVVHLGYEHPTEHSKMTMLKASGLVSYTRPGYIRPGSGTVARLVQTGTNFLRKKIRDPFKPLFAHKPDVVLYNGTCYSIAKEQQLLAHLAATGTKWFLLAHLNSDTRRDIDDAAAAVIRQAYAAARKVLFVSERSRVTAERHLCTRIDNAMLVRNPVNMASNEPLPYPAFDGPVQMAVVANLATVHKGQDILLQVLGAAHWLDRDWHLNIYGSGYDEQYLKDLVKRYGLEQRVFFHGRVADIRKVWATNQLLVLPSHMEGMPLAVVEAMICGRPCLVTDVGGNTEWVEDGRSGYIAAAATLNALNATLERAWQSRAQWAPIGTAAHERALSLYDPTPGATLLNILKA